MTKPIYLTLGGTSIRFYTKIGTSPYSELFLQGGKGYPKWGGKTDRAFWDTYEHEQKQLKSRTPKRQRIIEYLDWIYNQAPTIEAAGFKLMYGQAGAFPEILEYARDRQVSVVHLSRKNALDILVSKETAALRDLYHTRDNVQPGASRVRINIHQLQEKLAMEVRCVEKARQNLLIGTSFLDVTYEELKSNPLNFNKILAHIGIQSQDTRLTSTLKKIVQLPRSRVIVNYEEVVNALRGTIYEHFLDESE